MAESKMMDSDHFWELIFGVETLKSEKFLNEFNNKINNIQCDKEESIWDIFKSVNNEVLYEVQQMILKNPGCAQFIKCELSYFIPYQIKSN